MIYDFSHMFICLFWFCHGLPKGEIVSTYVIYLLGTYVIILCNWLMFDKIHFTCIWIDLGCF